MTNGTASTYHGPVITLEGIRRAMAELQDLPAGYDAPIRLTLRELDYLADLLGLQARPPTEPGPSSLLGIPIVILPEDSITAQFFSLRERILRTHRLLQIPPHPLPELQPTFRKAVPGEWLP